MYRVYIFKKRLGRMNYVYLLNFRKAAWSHVLMISSNFLSFNFLLGVSSNHVLIISSNCSSFFPLLGITYVSHYVLLITLCINYLSKFRQSKLGGQITNEQFLENIPSNSNTLLYQNFETKFTQNIDPTKDHLFKSRKGKTKIT